MNLILDPNDCNKVSIVSISPTLGRFLRIILLLDSNVAARIGKEAFLEPGWEGYVTLEFSNTTPLPAKIYANEGVAQFIFLKGNEKPEVTYADRNGKYMGQTGVTLPKV